MKQYVVDQLNREDCRRLRDHLAERYGGPQLESLFWLPLDEATLTERQRRHADCQPFYAAVELQENQLVCELLVRTRHRVRCSCMGYATERQRNWIIGCIDDILEQLKITT